MERLRRENIKKPLRYITTESSTDDDVIQPQKRQKIICMTDEINDIRNIIRHENEKIINNETMGNVSECIRAASETLALPLESVKEPKSIGRSYLSHGQISRMDMSSPHHFEKCTSLPTSNYEVLHNNEKPQQPCCNSTLGSTTSTVTFQNSTSTCTSSMPLATSATASSSSIIMPDLSNTRPQSLHSCATKHAPFSNVQPLCESDISSVPSTSDSSMHNRQTYNEMYPYEVDKNTGRFVRNIETLAQNATNSTSHECPAVSSVTQVSSLTSKVTNNQAYTSYNNNESTSNAERSQNVMSTSFLRSSHQSDAFSTVPSECDASITSLKLLPGSVPRASNTGNVFHKESTSNKAYVSANTSNSRNTTIQYENMDIKNIIQTQMMECMQTVMAEIRITKERLNRHTCNRRPIKPKEIPFEKTEDVLQFNEWNDAKYAEMVEYLAWIGGRNIRDCASLVFKEVFTTNVAQSFTWSGKDNNNRPIKTKLSDLRIMHALYDAISTNFKLTRSEFKYNISEALRSAKQRHRHQDRLKEKEN